MIFLDANDFLRTITAPSSGAEEMGAVDRDLFYAAVIAEVAFILHAKCHYNLPAAEVAARLRPFLHVPHLHLPRGQRQRHLRALDLWSAHPRLGFVDALTAVTVAGADIALATFDGDFDGLSDIIRWQPPATVGSGAAR